MSFYVTFRMAELKPGANPKDSDSYQHEDVVALIDTLPRERDMVFLGDKVKKIRS